MAVRQFASEDNSRYVLRSVHIEAGRGSAVLVATNGQLLGSVNVNLETPNEQPFMATIPVDAVDSIAKQCSRKATIDLEIFRDAERGEDAALLRVGVGRDRVEVRCGLVPGQYPDWRKVLPTEAMWPQAWVCLSPKLAERFIKAARLLDAPGGIKLGMRDGKSPMVVTLAGRPQFFGLWMPMNPEDNSGDVPPWLAQAVADFGVVDLPGMKLEEDSARWDSEEAIPLWTDEGVPSVLTVKRHVDDGKVMWCAWLSLKVGNYEMKETGDELPRAKQRADIIRRAGKRAKGWLRATFGKEDQAGFVDLIDKALEPHKERAE